MGKSYVARTNSPVLISAAALAEASAAPSVTDQEVLAAVKEIPKELRKLRVVAAEGLEVSPVPEYQLEELEEDE